MNTLRNNVRLIGNLGMTPELKELANNKKVARFSIATTESYKNEDGEKVSETQWHQVVVWGKQADIAGRYLSKGQEIALEGKLSNRNYTDKEGVKRYVTEIVAHEILMLGKKTYAETSK